MWKVAWRNISDYDFAYAGSYTRARDITLCLDRIHTISVSWADIAGLPALDQRLIPQLPSGSRH